MRISILLLGAVVGVTGLVGGARSDIIFNETFADGKRNGPDAAGMQWYVAAQNQTVSVGADATFGANAMHVTPGGGDAFKRMVGFTPVTTSLGSNVGDSLTLSFDYHATVNLATNANGFRFGLYNSNGTKETADTGSTSYDPTETNDYGYNARIPTGAAAAPTIYKEQAGDNTLGGTIPGTIITGTTSNVAIADQAAHHVIFELQRASATSTTITVTLDGTLVATGTDDGSAAPTGLITSFDAVYFGTGSSNGQAYSLTNIELVNSVSAPEPASLGMLAVGAGLALTRRRGRR